MAPVKRCRADSLCRGKIAAMEFHGEVGILKQVSGEHQHYVHRASQIPAATIS